MVGNVRDNVNQSLKAIEINHLKFQRTKLLS